VLYLLHGQTFNDEMWLDLGAKDITDDLISSGAAQPFLMVMPYEDFNNRQPDNNQFPNVVTDEIIPFVDNTFNTCTQRACRALGGISRGASWAVRLGLQHWELFGSLGAHSLPTFKGDLDELPDWLEQIPDGSAPRLYLDIGRFDPEIKTAYKFEQVLNEKGIMNEWHLNDGRHNTDYWKAHMREYLQWYARGWDAIK
jgi:enterochelin esterase-like enzyme